MKKAIFPILAVLAAFAIITAGCPSAKEEEGSGNSVVYTVTFDQNNTDTSGSTPPEPAVKKVQVDENRVGALPRAPTRSGGWNAGMTFDGWNTRADGTGTAFTGYTPVTGDITVYAKWKFSPGKIQFPDATTMVHDAPELTNSPTDDSTQGTTIMVLLLKLVTEQNILVLQPAAVLNL